MARDLSHCRLYAIVDLGYVEVANIELVATALIEGGADILQLRAKGHAPEDITGMARRIQPICREAGIPFIINDYPSIATEVGADGVHIGQDDGSLDDVRAQVGGDMIVGRSTHSPEQAEAAVAEGFDYIGFGPLFLTPTKQGRPGIGLDDVRDVQDSLACQIPVFCIGGIKRTNIPDVKEAGAYRVVIVSDLLKASDIKEATAQAKSLITDQ